MNNAGIDYGLGKANIDSETDCRYGVISFNSLADWIYDEVEFIYPDPELDEEGNEIEDHFGEPIGQELNTKEYQAHDAFDGTCLFLVKSIYYTFTKFCSPCAPGAGDLDSPTDQGVKTLCFGHDMFENNKAPYPVYRVSDNSLVKE